MAAIVHRLSLTAGVAIMVLSSACSAPSNIDGKSRYNLFDPVPAGEMRPLSTDAAPAARAYQP